MRRDPLFALGALCLFAGCGSKPDPIPTLALSTLPTCTPSAIMCMDGEPTSFEVDGVRVIHQRVQGHPLVSLQVKFDLPDDIEGAQYWAETLALDLLELGGPERLGPQAWTAKLAELSASVSTSAGSDYHSLSMVAPRLNWPTVWSLVAEALATPIRDEYYLDNRKGVRQYSYRAEADDPDRAVAAEAFSRLFRGSALNRARETQAAIAPVSMRDIDEAWRGLLVPGRLLVSVVGDLQQQDVEAAIRTRLTPLLAQYQPLFATIPRALGPTASTAILAYPDSPTWHICSYFVAPSPASRDYDAFALGLEVFDERLFAQIRDERGLAYTTGARSSFFRRGFGSLWLTTNAPVEALGLVRDLAAQLKSTGPDAGELERAHQILKENLLAAGATPQGLAWQLADWQLTTGSFADLQEYETALETISTDEVTAALRSYLQHETTAAAGPGSTVTDTALQALF